MFPIPAAKRLIEELDKTEFEVVMASWLYNREDDEWKLVIASPFIDKNGALAGYKFVRETLDQIPQDPEESLRPLTTLDIVLRGSKDRFTKEFRKRVEVGRDEYPKMVRLNPIEGVPIDDAYVYRS